MEATKVSSLPRSLLVMLERNVRDAGGSSEIELKIMRCEFPDVYLDRVVDGKEFGEVRSCLAMQGLVAW